MKADICIICDAKKPGGHGWPGCTRHGRGNTVTGDSGERHVREAGSVCEARSEGVLDYRSRGQNADGALPQQ